MTDPHTINLPRQERSRLSQTRIIDAASELLGERAFDDITVTDIAQRAKLSTGALYSRFTSKTAVLYAIQQRYLGQLELDARAACETAVADGQAIPELLYTVFRLIGAPGLASRGVMHAVTSESTRDLQVMGAINRFVATLSDILFVALTKLEEAHGRAVHRMDIVFATRACLAMMQQEWLYPERPSDGAADPEVLARHLSRLFTGYVRLAD